MVKRKLSYEEEQVIRLVHHDHRGLSIEAAAAEMGLSIKEVKRLLRSTKRKAPQLFPILTPEHRAILMMYDQHRSRTTITEALDITLPMLKRRVGFLREHGFLWTKKMERYEPFMDSQVKERF